MLTIAKAVGEEKNLQLNEAQLTKIMELNEQLNRRMGVVVVVSLQTNSNNNFSRDRRVLEKARCGEF